MAGPGGNPAVKSFRAPGPLELALRLALAYFAAVALVQVLERPLVEALLPGFHCLLEAINGAGRIASLELKPSGADTALVLHVRLTHPVLVDGRWLVPGPTSTTISSLATGAILFPVVVALGAVLAWPARRLQTYALRLLLLGLLLPPILFCDAPLTLSDLNLNTVEGNPFPPFHWWYGFLNNGGRGFLGLLAALAALGLSGRFDAGVRRTSAAQGNAATDG